MKEREYVCIYIYINIYSMNATFNNYVVAYSFCYSSNPSIIYFMEQNQVFFYFCLFIYFAMFTQLFYTRINAWCSS
jgi:hypothetical protein